MIYKKKINIWLLDTIKNQRWWEEYKESNACNLLDTSMHNCQIRMPYNHMLKILFKFFKD